VRPWGGNLDSSRSGNKGQGRLPAFPACWPVFGDPVWVTLEEMVGSSSLIGRDAVEGAGICMFPNAECVADPSAPPTL